MKLFKGCEKKKTEENVRKDKKKPDNESRRKTVGENEVWDRECYGGKQSVEWK